MASLGEVLKKEIARLARKEIRVQTEDLRRQSVAHRKTIAELRRRVSALESKSGLLERKVLVEAPVAAPDADVEQPRFSKKGIISARRRLSVTAAEFGKLIGVSGQTVYNWENGKSRPRAKQLQALGELRGMGKREAAARLALLAKG
jgi:DNA-binding transcriptional regulator YiaG